MTADEARAYLSGLSAHRERSYDTAYMHPDLARRLATAIQQARAEGMPVTLLSGVRQPSDHPSNYDLGGFSSHEYGLAADVDGIGRPGGATSARWRQIAEANGLSSPYAPTGGEWNHWQIGPRLETAPQLLAALQTARTTGSPQQVWTAYDNYAGGGPATPGLAAQPRATGTRFIDALAQIESGRQDIYSTVDRDYAGQPGSRSQGFFQIDTPTWQQFAQRAGVDVTRYPQAKGAPYEVQTAVAQAIPLHRFGQQTQDKLAKIFGPLDNNLTIGELNTRYGGGGTPSPAPAPAAGGGGAGASGAPQLTPQQRQLSDLGASLGQTLAGIGAGSGAGAQLSEPADQPAIRAPALWADFGASTPNPVPAGLAGGVGGAGGAPSIGAQLGALPAQPADTMAKLMDPAVAPSITAGAPSMTALLGQIGTTDPDLTVGPTGEIARPNLMNPLVHAKRKFA